MKSKIPKGKLLLMGNAIALEKEFRGVYQDFANDIYNAPTEGLDKIRKCKRIILTFPTKSVYPYIPKGYFLVFLNSV